MVERATDPESFDRLLSVLSAGGVAIVPCDTMYGIVGIVPDTGERIRRIKGRGEEKPFLQLIAHVSWVELVSDAPVPPSLAKYWPGPLTLVFPAREGGTIAFRLPDSPFLQRLLTRLGRSVYSTSVNRAGKQPIFDITTIAREFSKDVDVVYDAGNIPPGPPSTLIDITSKPYQVLREGAIKVSPEELELG
ncbi:MAG TPA: L-threonylcarbamoyladenylate synthase [Spirochaetia bacterium]|nr:L-threonylcarbamoyladenylate synthase [Spirochaetia bacterium]